ncbi:MAG: RnfABCDGE type electron transport complex subunit D [Flavobacteriales bacterium]|nr:RnfABCDGE type electron transport complex subunit D [Flavobacteriales bacterium]
MQALIGTSTRLRSFIQDPRHFQIVFLGGFLTYGVLALGWDSQWMRYATLFGTCVGIQTIFIRWKGIPWSSLKSAVITALGMCLLLQAGSIWTLVFGATVAIAGKFLLRWKGRHIFNPGNLGIAAAVALTGDAWVSPGQWGSGAMLVFLVVASGSIMVLRVGRIDTSVAFLGTFAALVYIRTVWYLGWGADVWWHQLTNGSLLLFTFFMITDPMTTPRSGKARWLWGMGIAVLAFAFSWHFWIHAAPIWALLLGCALNPLIDHLMHGEPFHWVRPVPHSQRTL